MTNLKDILAQFGIQAESKPIGNGHINTTFLVESEPRTVLQRINTNVFHKPEEVMANIFAVTEYLREKITEAGGDPQRETLTFLRTVDGSPCYLTPDGEAYRMYVYLDDVLSLEQAESPADFAESAHGFGKFQRMLDGFPAERLYETIPHFHDTGDRLRQLEEAVAQNKSGRAGEVAEEIAFARAHAGMVNRITDAIKNGKIPLRVTHNDTKLNNVMLDAKTKKALCVIDLDTVMPGSLLYDFGDAIRFGASTAAEDEPDLSKVHFDMEYYNAFAEAFLSELGDRMTQTERDYLPLSAILMTLECGMRFLADHINGDTYFKIHRPAQNLDRCRTQFKLVKEMEARFC